LVEEFLCVLLTYCHKNSKKDYKMNFEMMAWVFSGTRCKQLASGLADDSVSQSSLSSLKSGMDYLFVAGLPSLCWKRGC